MPIIGWFVLIAVLVIVASNVAITLVLRRDDPYVDEAAEPDPRPRAQWESWAVDTVEWSLDDEEGCERCLGAGRADPVEADLLLDAEGWFLPRGQTKRLPPRAP